MSILLFVALLCGCKGRGNENVNDESNYWFLGYWRADDGSMFYISDIEETAADGYNKARLFIKRNGEETGSYDVCWVSDKGDNVSIWTVDEYDFDKDSFVAEKEANQIRDAFHSNLVFHRDDSIAELVSKEIIRTNEQKGKEIEESERIANEEIQNIQNNYDWIYGDWISQQGSITIKQPNQIHVSWVDFGEWWTFTINDGIMWVDYGQEGDRIDIDSKSQTLTYVSTMDENIRYQFYQGGNNATSDELSKMVAAGFKMLSSQEIVNELDGTYYIYAPPSGEDIKWHSPENGLLGVKISDGNYTMCEEFAKLIYTTGTGNITGYVPLEARYTNGRWYKQHMDKVIRYAYVGFNLDIESMKFKDTVWLGNETKRVEQSPTAMLVWDYDFKGGVWFYRGQHGYKIFTKNGTKPTPNANN